MAWMEGRQIRPMLYVTLVVCSLQLTFGSRNTTKRLDEVTMDIRSQLLTWSTLQSHLVIINQFKQPIWEVLFFSALFARELNVDASLPYFVAVLSMTFI